MVLEHLYLIGVNGSYVIPESYKSTYSGSVTVENGRIVEQNGAQTDIDIESVASPKFEFNEDCFSSALIKEGYFEADISDPNTFFSKCVYYFYKCSHKQHLNCKADIAKIKHYRTKHC